MWCLRFWDCCSPVSLTKMLSTIFSALPPPVMKLRVITFHDPGTDLSSNPKLRPAALHRHQVVGLHDAGLDALHIQRTDGSQIDHLTQTKTGCGLASHGAQVVCVSCYKKKTVPLFTSHSIPSLARTAAVSRQWPTYREWLTRVMWFPETVRKCESDFCFTTKTLPPFTPEYLATNVLASAVIY